MKRKGFTLIEVTLFLGLTGLLFVGIVAGTNNSIVQQRFFDSTQSFAEFLRSVYSQVSNPEGVGTGRSELAIYGKMISFGQHYDLAGRQMYADDAVPDDGQKVFVYDVVGDVKGTGSGTAVNMMREVNANVAVFERDATDRITNATVAGIAEAYEPRWGATVETTTERPMHDAAATGANANLYTGTILVVRHPQSGTINTLISPEVIEVNRMTLSDTPDYDAASQMLMRVLCAGVTDTSAATGVPVCDGINNLPATSAFETREVNFCINPGGVRREEPLRWNIRLVRNARNASGVETIDRDDFKRLDGDSYNMCRDGLSED